MSKSNFEINPTSLLSADPAVKAAADAEGAGLRWIAKDASGVKFRAKQWAGAIPVEDHPEHHDLKLHKLPREVIEKHNNQVQEDSDRQMSRIFETYEDQHMSATGRKPKISASMRRDKTVVAADNAMKKRYFFMGGGK